MNDKARSTSSGVDQEVGATPLINSKNHGPTSDQIARLIYHVRGFVDYTARVQRIDGRVVKNYADAMRRVIA